MRDRQLQRSDWLTVPNALTLARILGSALLVVLAANGNARAFLYLFLFLAATDWVDGKLAVVLNQRSELGARLDSYGDFVLYAAAFAGAAILDRDVLAAEWPYIGGALVAFLASLACGYLKFGCWPSYHTLSAKSAWWLVVLAVIGLGSDWSSLALRVACIAVAAANLEALLLTFVLRKPRVNVKSVFAVLSERKWTH